MRTIEDNGSRLALLIRKDEAPTGLSFFSNEGDFIQVGKWGYDKGKSLQPHIHNKGVIRQIDRTQEVIYVIEGKLEASILDEAGNLVEHVIAEKGDTLVMLAGGHGYKILTDNTIVLEVKNGPYVGAEKDRRRLNVSGRSPEASTGTKP